MENKDKNTEDTANENLINENSKLIISDSLKQRIITAGILVFCLGVFCYLAIYFIWARVILLGIAFLTSILSLYEFISFTAKSNIESQNSFNKQLVYSLALGLPLVATFVHYILPVLINIDRNYIFNLDTYTQGILITALALLTSIWSLTFYALSNARDDNSKVESYIKEIFPAFILLCLGGSFLISIAALPFAPIFIIWLITIVAASDIGAYFTGKFFGGDKLIPAISPNKTISGSIGGLLSALIIGFLISPLFYLAINMPISKICIFSIIISAVSQIGDILQSYIKRLSQVKDSSNILPGHGGVFDRIDGLLATTPIFFLVIIFLLYT